MTMTTALGEFEQVVLLAILRLGDEAYAVAVQNEIERCTGRDLSRGSIYITLDRLETKGYLRSRATSPRTMRPVPGTTAALARSRRCGSRPCASRGASGGSDRCTAGRCRRSATRSQAPGSGTRCGRTWSSARECCAASPDSRP